MTETSLHILIVDDEPAIRRFLRTSLGAHGHTIEEAANGEDAVKLAALNQPDLVILDLGLPDMDGVEVTRRLREWTQIPIIILSVRDHENDKISALDAGADDYLTKPFSTGELLARIRVSMRHAAQPKDAPIYQVGELVVDLARRTVTVQGQGITLTPTEYDILCTLIQYAGRVLTHKQLLRTIWGNAYESETHLLRVNVSNLRRKIEPNASRPTYILTEPGVGYRLKST
jgi:two-component system KDP operon response regulator KdpE